MQLQLSTCSSSNPAACEADRCGQCMIGPRATPPQRPPRLSGRPASRMHVCYGMAKTRACNAFHQVRAWQLMKPGHSEACIYVELHEWHECHPPIHNRE